MFHKGQKVICIRDAVDRNYDGKYTIKKDTVLTVRRSVTTISQEEGLMFEEIILPESTHGNEFVYSSVDFAPYNPPRIQYVAVDAVIREKAKERVKELS